MVRLIDLAIRVQESTGALSLDEEIRRYIRVVRKSDTAEWSCSAHAAAALLDFVGDFLAAGGLDSAPPEFRQKLAQASEGIEPAEYLQTLAGIVRILDRDLPPEYSELPMNTWEVGLTFPLLRGFTAALTDDLESVTLSDSVRAYIATEHPFCPESLAPWAAEAHRALVLFPDAESLQANLLQPIPWISADALRELLRTVDEHMMREHR
ncbi:hypothetical protein NLX86_12260 [Streptomyces sp. A3M-1-3]|uniref:hypothetical protein n=1 Tax=Streptomyces sp. A3M-1-3 TaxID=2962044 RepID=UPI0020B7F589|nr:hypothetical protein [Streptomyces sp. A3M-1-3]MCP3818854.1 hypothetical protein [Streptomyces sp. A3M-1-3]